MYYSSMKFITTLTATFMLSACVTTGNGVDTLNIHNKSVIQVGAEVFKAEKLPAPTVVVMHGCGGVDQHHIDWAKQLQAWGFNAVVLDSFKPRGVSNACTKAMIVTPLQRAIDVHLVAKWARDQPWSEKKVGAIGFSHGGWAVLHAATKQDPEREIGASYLTSAVAFYPYCGTSFNFFSRAIPLQMHIGKEDNWTPATICKDLARNWNMSNDYFEHVNAHHGFDRFNTDLFVQGTGASGPIENRILRSDKDANIAARGHVKHFFEKTLR
jgi:dienelactone hydrolase